MTQRDPAPGDRCGASCPCPPPVPSSGRLLGGLWKEQAPWTDGPGFHTPSAPASPNSLAVYSGQVTTSPTTATSLENRMKTVDLSRAFPGLAKLVPGTQSPGILGMAHPGAHLSAPG